MEIGIMRSRGNYLICLLGFGFLFGNLHAESEPIDPGEIGNQPYAPVGRLFAASSQNGSKQSGSGAAVGPGVVLTAAHVYWKEVWGSGDTELPNGASPWLAFREWYPQAASSNDTGFDNVVSVVSLAGYDDALHEYDENRNDSTSPFEAFNRDSLLLIFSDDAPTPHGYLPIHPRAVESGFLGKRNYYEVIGYPSAKYSGSDSRKWVMHRTNEREPIVLSRVPSTVYDGGYSFENRLFFGGDPLDSYAGNSGGPVVARSRDTERWSLIGVYVGSNALIRCADEALAEMVNIAVSAQFETTESRFRFTDSSLVVGEADGQLTVGVERLGDSSGAATVSLGKIDFLAQQTEDYDGLGTFSWDAGESGVKENTLAINEDDLREGGESFLLDFDLPDGGPFGLGSLFVTIEDNDLNEPLDQWTIIDEVGAADYSEVVFAEGLFVSAGKTNAIFWTPDYQETGVVDFPGLNRLYQVIHARGLFIACGDGPDIIISEDGKTWEVVELPTSIGLLSIQYGLGWFVAVGGIDALTASQGEVWISKDAREWIKVYDERHARFEDVEFGNGIFLAKAGDDFYRSSDVMTWEKLVTTGLGGEPGDFEFGAGRFVNAGRLGGIHYSTDGVSWTRARQEDDGAWYGVGYRNGYFLATGISGKLATSTDGGVTWIDRYPPTAESLWHGTVGVGKMMIIGDNGLLMEASLPEYFDYTFQPVSQSVIIGDSVEFFAGYQSSMAGPYTMRWQKNGEDISGEIVARLNLSDVGLADAGSYQLIVTGNGNEYRSEIATLDVALDIHPPENTTASTTTSRGATITWDDVSTGETGYRIDRREIGSDNWIVVAELPADSTFFTDRNLVPDTSYEYRVSTLAESEVIGQETTNISTLSTTNFVNLSTRGLVGKNDEVLIGGFTIPAGPPMTLYIRGLGPSLTDDGVVNALSDPQLKLAQYPGTNPVEIINHNWMDAENVTDILELDLPPENELESAILTTLPPGGYTIILSNELDGPPAVGLIEIYDVTENCTNCRLTNLSSRGLVSLGDELMIGGLIISGPADKSVFVRALGPSLPGIESPLLDPVLKLVSGSGEEALINNWMDSANAAIFSSLGLPAIDTLEASELYKLRSGAHTFHITGADGTSGVALLEIYEAE
jgi:hypothetical protein